jgi:hypothetical protein
VADVEPGTILLGARAGAAYWSHNTILWTDSGADKTPGGWEIVGIDWATPVNFRMDGDKAYYSHHNRISKLTFSPDGMQVARTDVALGLPVHPNGIALLGQCAYTLGSDVECLGRGGRGRVMGTALDDRTTCRSWPVAAHGLQPIAFAMDDQYAYWIDGSCARRFEPKPTRHLLASRRASNQQSGDEPPSDPIIVFDDEPAAGPATNRLGLYWATPSGLWFSPRNQLAPRRLIQTTKLSGFTLGDTVVVYSDEEGIHVVEKPDGKSRRVVKETGARNLVTDGEAVYWIDRESKAIYAVKL